MATTKCTFTLIVDAAGDIGVGRDFDLAKEDYEACVQELTDSCGFRVLNFTLDCPLPDPIEIAATIPEQGGEVTPLERPHEDDHLRRPVR